MHSTLRGLTTASALAMVLALSENSFAADIAGSGVSVSGRIDAGIISTNNIANADGSSGSRTRAAGNQWGSSLFGFDASKALDGGNTIYGRLETGFNTVDGSTNDKSGATDGRLWARRAYAGVKNEGWGHIQFGKDLSISNDIWYIDPMGQQGSGSASLVGGRNWQMAPGGMEYGTPSFGGVTFTGQYSPGGQVGDNKVGSKAGIEAAYTNGPIDFRLIYDTAASTAAPATAPTCQTLSADNASCTAWTPGSAAAAGGKYDDVFNASKEIIVGAAYKVGAATIFAGYNGLDAPDADGVTKAKKAHQSWLGLNYQATAPLLLRAAVYTGGTEIDQAVDANGSTPATYGGKKGTLVALGGEYALDKQLSVWLTYAQVSNGSNSNYSAENYWDAVPLMGKNQSTVNGGFIFSF